MSNPLPIVLNPRQPEAYQLTQGGPATGNAGFIPPSPLGTGNNAGTFFTERRANNVGQWRFQTLASRIRASGRVIQNIALGVTRTLDAASLGADGSDSLLMPVAVENVGGTDYPIYINARDRIEFILRLWHDKGFSVSSIFAAQVADMISYPLNMEVYGFDLWVNPNTAPGVDYAEVYTVMMC